MVCKDYHPAGKPFQNRCQQIVQIIQCVPVLGNVIRFQLPPIAAQEIEQYTGSLCHQLPCRIRIGIGVMALIEYVDVEQSIVLISCVQQKIPQLLRRGLIAVRHLDMIAFHIMAEIRIEINLPSLAYRLFDKRAGILFYLAFFIISCAQIIVSTVCGNQALIGRRGCCIRVGKKAAFPRDELPYPPHLSRKQISPPQSVNTEHQYISLGDRRSRLQLQSVCILQASSDFPVLSVIIPFQDFFHTSYRAWKVLD